MFDIFKEADCRSFVEAIFENQHDLAYPCFVFGDFLEDIGQHELAKCMRFSAKTGFFFVPLWLPNSLDWKDRKKHSIYVMHSPLSQGHKKILNGSTARPYFFQAVQRNIEPRNALNLLNLAIKKTSKHLRIPSLWIAERMVEIDFDFPSGFQFEWVSKMNYVDNYSHLMIFGTHKTPGKTTRILHNAPEYNDPRNDNYKNLSVRFYYRLTEKEINEDFDYD